MSTPTSPATHNPDRTPRIFISHSHLDEAVALRLAGDFQQAGAYVWIDKHDITDGDFLKRINEGLAKCDWLVLVETANSLTSPAVEMEVNAAQNRVLYHQMRGIIRLIAGPRDPRTVPPTWATLQYYDATKNYAVAVRDTLAAIRDGDMRWQRQHPTSSNPSTPSTADAPIAHAQVQSPQGASQVEVGGVDGLKHANSAPQPSRPNLISTGGGEMIDEIGSVRSHPPVVPRVLHRSKVVNARALVIALIAVCVVVVFGAGIPTLVGRLQALTTTPTQPPRTATTTPTPTSSLPTALFTKTGLYSVRYPAAWFVTQQSNVGGNVALFSAQQSAGINPAINIQVIPANESAPDMTTRDNDILKASATGNTIHNQTGPTSLVVGGQTWTEVAADLTLTGTTQIIHEVALSVAHGQKVYSVTYFATPADFANMNAVAFQPILASFAFLS